MKKTLAIILSIIMLIGAMPFASFAAEPAYDRGKVAANDEAYIESMSAEQIASVILDWVDREIAKYSAEIEDDIVAGVIANGGFEEFEAFLGKDALGNIIAENMPEITSLDAVIGYKDYLKELGGDFANLDATALVTRAEAGSALGFIDGVFEFMAANSETFGKVFRWDGYVVDENGAVTDYGNVFDYGKVGDYIETLNGSADADEQAIYDFYINYLVGNDIQAKFTKWVADQMGYEISEGESFDDIIDDGIRVQVLDLCEQSGLLSADALNEIMGDNFDLRTNDIYTLIKRFVALVEEDNEVKIDTLYNFFMDTVARTLIKTMLGQKAVVGAEKEVPASFYGIYTDLELLESLSGGTAYYYDGTDYYQITIKDGVATANALTWEAGFELNLEPVYATVSTGADRKTAVKTYEPKSTDIAISTYASEKNQNLVKDTGLEFTGTEVPADIAELMKGEAKALADGFLLKVTQGEQEIADLDISFEELEAYVKSLALTAAKSAVKGILSSQNLAEDAITVEALDFNIVYNAWTTDDEFVCAVDATDISVKLGGTVNSFILGIAQSAANTAVSTAVGNIYDTPIATIVVDGLAGGGADYFGQAKALLDFVNDDFVVDQTLLDFTANYDAYNGVVGQANRVLVGLVDMLVSEGQLDLTEGGNEYLTDNLQKICDKANAMMTAANDLINNEDLQKMIGELGIDLDVILGELDLDILYSIDFSSVEALWVSVIKLGLKTLTDCGYSELDGIYALVKDCANLDAMAVAVTDNILADCIPALNDALANAGFDFALTVPSKTDAKAVADGKGKDIIMRKLVDVIYEAAVEGVVLVNDIANDALSALAAETGSEMPAVAFELDVEKGATWMDTLTALTNRVYELADGIIIACDNEYTDTIDKISAVANAVLPLGALASNCAGNGFAFDGNKVLSFIFDDGLEGDLDGFLRLFETKEKTEDVAANVSVTEALIMASEHIVDAFFPDTVKSELYVNLADYNVVSFVDTTVQDYFTSAENDAVIASNNMDSINARKAELVPAVLNLAREAGVLPFFAKCDKDHDNLTDAEKKIVTGTAATCTSDGIKDAVYCADCGYFVSGGDRIPATHTKRVNKVKVDSTCTSTGTEAGVYCEDCKTWVSGGATIAKKSHSYTWKVTTAAGHESSGIKTGKCTCGDTKTEAIAATGHSFGGWTVTKAATCEENGIETRMCSCGKTETRTFTADHVDENKDNECDNCGKTINNSFGAKLKAFFQKIINWFKNLFK